MQKKKWMYLALLFVIPGLLFSVSCQKKVVDATPEPVAEEKDLFGTAVNLARRICDHAEPGQILVSDVVQQLAAGKGFTFADKGEATLKGFEKPVRLHEVVWD